jgi:putative transposase
MIPLIAKLTYAFKALWETPTIVLVSKLGYQWNHKRVHRVYNALNLNLRRKSKRRLPARNPQPLSVPNALGHTWSMDFMSDRLHNNIRFRTFNMIDNYNREV